MEAFARLHPAVILFYYVVGVWLMVWIGHPLLCGGIWLVCLIDYGCMEGRRKLFRTLMGGLSVACFCLVVNPILNRRGVTLLFLVGRFRITGESVLYGGNMAVILLASLMIFSCMSHYMSAEKIMALFGRRFPSFALLFSMILRLVPKAGHDFREMTSRHGSCPAVWSALLGFMLEDSMERSIAMQNRGYGSRCRSSYYARPCTKEDIVLLAGMALLVIPMVIYLHIHPVSVRFFPSVRIETMPMLVWGLLFLFYMIPLLWRGKDELQWYLSRQKIISSDIPEQKSRPLQ